MPRYRKSLDDKLADVVRRQNQLEAQRSTLLTAKKAADRKLDARRKIIVGAVILAHAALDPSFADQLRQVLDEAVMRPVDRAVIADLLPPDQGEAMLSPAFAQVEAAA